LHVWPPQKNVRANKLRSDEDWGLWWCCDSSSSPGTSLWGNTLVGASVGYLLQHSFLMTCAFAWNYCWMSFSWTSLIKCAHAHMLLCTHIYVCFRFWTTLQICIWTLCHLKYNVLLNFLQSLIKWQMPYLFGSLVPKSRNWGLVVVSPCVGFTFHANSSTDSHEWGDMKTGWWFYKPISFASWREAGLQKVDCIKDKCEVHKKYPIKPEWGSSMPWVSSMLGGGEWWASCSTALLQVPMENYAECSPDLVWA
jgi:hypothetical protein